MDRIAPSRARRLGPSVLGKTLRAALIALFVGCGEKPAADPKANQGDTDGQTAGMGILVFGPQDYVRHPGAPVLITTNFSAQSPPASAYTLHIANGGARGQYDRVASAVVTLNGEVVAAPQDFSQRVAVIDKSVRLLDQNTLSVEVRSAPGSGFTLQLANHAPLANAGPDQTVSVGQTVQLQGNGSSDVDGGSLAYRWTLVNVPAGSHATLSNPTSVQPTFVVDRSGAYVVSLTVNDGQLDSAPDMVQLSTQNSPPVANAGPDQSVAVGQTFTLDGSQSSDVDGDPLTYHWTLLSRPAQSRASLSDPTAVKITFEVDAAGLYVAQLIVGDGQADSAPAMVQITTVNSPPVANAGPAQAVPVRQTVVLDGRQSSDVDGDPLTYLWSFTALPPGSTATLSNDKASQPTFVVDLPGIYVAQLIVNDGHVDSAPATVMISTRNSKPVANAGPDQQVAAGDMVTLDGSGSSDVDRDSLTFRWTLLTLPAGSTAVLSSLTAITPTFVADTAGIYVAQLVVNDGQLDSDPATVTISASLVDTRPPDLRLEPPDGALRNTAALLLTITYSDDASRVDLGSLRVQLDDADATALFAVTATSATFLATLADGPHRLAATLQDHVGNVALATSQFTIDTVPPAFVNPLLVSVGPVTGGQVTVTGAPGSVEANARVRLANARTGQTVTVGATAAGGFTATLPAQSGDSVILAAEDAAGNTGTPSTVTVGGNLPPDPATVAPPVDRSVATDLLTSSKFLYTGSDPIQTGVARGAIDPKRVAVLRGLVMTRDGQPLPGVSISVRRQPELGQTLSRADGRFDLVVNGGGAVLIDYTMAGYLAVQRQVQAPMQDFATASDVAMIPMDAQVSSIDLSSTQPMQVARGSRSTDSDGTRQATLLFPSSTAAIMVFPDGSTQPLFALSVRATEYTVGPNGPSAMSADLPPTSGYTYALEFSVDEAKMAGAIDVRFSRPLPLYVENFLDFPVGTGVPLGSYDRGGGVWVAEDSGRVIKILDVTDGQASLDLDGDGIADGADALAALRITDAERQRVATLYRKGQSLWRVLIPHFDQTRDCNWPLLPPDGAEAARRDARRRNLQDQCCQTAGSIIESQNQILGEVLGVVGTGFALHYQSERAPGRNEAYRVDIPLSDASIPPSLKRIDLEIGVAGQFHKKSFPAASNQQTSFVWDGKNAYGQVLQGEQPITVRIGYTYSAGYGATQRFGYSGTDLITGSRSRGEVTLWRTWRDLVGAFDTRGVGLGGWTLSPHHTFTPLDRVVYRGDGKRQTARTMPSTISTVVGTGICGLTGDGGLATQAQICPAGLAFGPDGSLYLADPAVRRIRRVAPDGIITTVAGNSDNCSSGPCGDGGPAVLAQLASAIAVAVGPDNSLYISEQLKVRKVGPDGIITTLAGTGIPGFSGDGGPAPLAQLGTILSLATGPDGSVYLADQTNFRIRRIGPDGIIDTVAGTGVSGFSGDGGPAARAGLDNPRGIAVGQDGSLYIADHVRVRRVTSDGVIRTIAGSGSVGFSGDGGPATQASFGLLTAVAVAPDDTLYLADSENFRIRWMRPAGTINTLAGTGVSGTSGDGGPAREARLQEINFGLAVAPDGGIYVSQSANDTRVRRISPVLDALLAGDGNGYLVPSPGGGEVYRFSLAGQHLRTIDALTGVVRYQFAYDGSGRLASITDRNGNLTTIEHDGSGRPTAIAGPFGQRTLLAVNGDDYLDRLASPAGAAATMTYTPLGLLTSFTNPRGQTSRYTYDSEGRLSSATDATGATKTLVFSGTQRDYTVTMTTALGRTTAYRVEELDNGDVRSTTTDPAGIQAFAFIGQDGVETARFADGTTARTVLGPDPRWGMQAPIVSSLTVSTPGGKVLTATARRTVTLAAANDLFSLRTLTDTFSLNDRVAITVFDAPSRTLTSTSATGVQSRVVVDDRARPIEMQFGDLSPISYAYDTRGRLTSSTQADRMASVRYGDDGLPSSTTDPLGRTLRVRRDADGQITELTLPDGRLVRYAYDLDGNVSAVTPPERTEHLLAYTPRDEVASYVPPLVGTADERVGFTYDADRQPLRVDRADGQGARFQYDAAGRLSLIGLALDDRRLGYDAANRLTSLTTLLTSMTHDSDGGLPTSTTWSGAISGSVGRSFDGNFRLTALSVNGASLALTYDADGRLVQAGSLTLSRDPRNGLPTGTALGDASDTWSFNSFGEPIAYTAAFAGSAMLSQQYTRNKLRRITQRIETIGGVTDTFAYGYDLAGRLTRVTRNGVTVASYSYDGNGNRLSISDASGTTSATYDAQDRLTQYGPASFTHTPNGERQSKTVAGQTTTYRYDSLGFLSGVSLPAGAQIDYVLDGKSRRVGKRVNDKLVQGFLYQGDMTPIAELDGASNVVSRFVYASRLHVPDYMIKGGVTYRIVADHLGSPRLVFNVATGAIAQRIDYDEFGRVVADTNPGFQPFGLGGGIHDQDTKLVHFAAREYDPEVGRWITREPIPFVGGDSNLYEYAFGDPINFLDRNGLGADLILVFAADPPQEDTGARGVDIIRAGLKYRSAEGEYVVLSHGVNGQATMPAIWRDGDDWGLMPYRTISPHFLAQVILLDINESKRSLKRVKLISCAIDKDYAIKLATQLGVPVLYSPETVHLRRNGRTISDECAGSGCLDPTQWQTALPLTGTARRASLRNQEEE